MAKLERACMGLAVLGSCICLANSPAALAQSQYYAGSAQSHPDSAAQAYLGSGLHIDGADFAASDSGEELGRYGWLRSGLTPTQHDEARVARPSRGPSIGLSVDQLGRHDAQDNLLHLPGVNASAVHLEASYLFGRKWGLASQYAAAGGPLSPSIQPGLQGFSASSESLGVSLFRMGTLLRGDRLSLTVSSPVRTGFGGLLANGAGAGYVLADSATGSRQDAQGYSTEISYFTPLSREAKLGFSVSRRSNALLDFGVPDERVMSIRFSSRF